MNRKEIKEYLKSTGILYCGGFGNNEFHQPGSSMLFCWLLPKGVYFFRLNGSDVYYFLYEYEKLNEDCLDYQLRRYLWEIKIMKQRTKLKEMERDFE